MWLWLDVKKLKKQYIITVSNRVLNDPLTQVFAGQIKVQNVYFLMSIYCSRASQNNLTSAIVPELVFTADAAPRRNKVINFIWSQ